MTSTDPPRVLVVENGADGPPGRVGDWLVEAGCELDVRRPYAGDELPASLEAHDAMIVLGGEMGAGDDATYPWLALTKELVREAAADDRPTLGICLGHQLCAVALGGRVELNPHGPQLGLVEVTWGVGAAQDPLLGPVTAARHAVHWNTDVVLDLPRGAEVLARADGVEAEAVRFAPSVWGIQLHPEVDARAIAPWADDWVGSGRDDADAMAVVLADVETADDRLERDWRPLGVSFSALARARRDADRDRA